MASSASLPTPLNLDPSPSKSYPSSNSVSPASSSAPVTPLHKRSPMERGPWENLSQIPSDTKIQSPTVSLTQELKGKVGKGVDRERSASYKRLSYVHADLLRHSANTAKKKVEEDKNKYIHPKDPKKIRWDIYCGVLIVYSVMIIPWRIGFEVEAEGLILYFDYMVDICFAFDMLMCCFTAIYEEDRLITDLGVVRVSYAKSWFFPDLLSTVPIDKVVELVIGGGAEAALNEMEQGASCEDFTDTGDGGAGNELAGFRLIRILRLARLLKLMRLLKLSQKASAVDMNEMLNPAIRKLLGVLGKIMFMAHLLSCVWVGVNDCAPLAKFASLSTMECDEDNNQVVTEYEADWVACGEASLTSQYFASFYWTIATMMAVGYGDVSPHTTAEKVYGIVTQVVGAMSFGLIIATVGIIVDTINPEATIRKRKLDTLQAFMSERGCTKMLKRQVKDHFEYYYANKTVFPEAGIMMSLPANLKAQLIFELNKKNLSDFHIFHNLDVVFATDLVIKLKPMCLGYRQSLGTFGGFNSEGYFIAKGRVQALSPVGVAEMSICALFKNGDDFELDSMLTDQVMRCTYRAISVTDLFWVDLSDFRELSDEYPACGENIRFHAMQHKNRMDISLASETKDLPGVGLCQSIVTYDLKSYPIEDVISFFEVTESSDSNKIRTYRNVEVGANGEPIMPSFMKSPSSAKLSINVNPSATISPSATPKSATTVTTPKTQEKRFSTSAPVGSASSKDAWADKNDSSDDVKGEESLSSEPPGSNKKDRQTFAIIRRKDSMKSQGSMLSLDTPMALFKHSSFKRKKRVKVEVEETTAELAKRYVINPKQGQKIAWDLFVGALILWSVIMVPYRLGFDQEPEDNSPMFWLDVFVDIMFGLDIVLCFRTAYQDEQLVYVTEPRMIANNYFRGWFSVDFLSTFPIDRIIMLFNDAGGAAADVIILNATLGGVGEEEEEGGNAARSLKMIKILRLIRLSKLARLLKLKNLVKGMDEILALSAVVMKALQLVTTMVFIGHLFGCFWNYTSSNFTDLILEEEEAKTRVWWMAPLLQEDAPEGSQLTLIDVGGMYIASLYWAFTTMTTVGYGDILPTNDVERVYATLIMVLGATIFGYIVGSVGALAINVNGAPARKHARVSTAMNYLTEQGVSKVYKDSVKKQVLYYLQCKSPFNEDGSLLEVMPREIKRELILQCHKEIVPFVPLFKRQSRDFVAHLLTKMRPQKVTAGNVILNSDLGSDGIYFLMKGTAKMDVMDKSKPSTLQGAKEDEHKLLRSVFIEVGRFFGHEIYVDDELNHAPDLYRVYKSVHDCELFVLLDMDVSHMLESHPNLASQLKLALHQMISAQPPIMINTNRARKQRKSFHSFVFGSAKVHPGTDNTTSNAAQAAANLRAKLKKSASQKAETIKNMNEKLSEEQSSNASLGGGLERKGEKSIRFSPKPSE
ncbi:hypothetical protein TL16_g05353 [Triparma laevis f. inornata]|uniref:Cyclic nucleotide-binding domain-containing protein n=1 Tax=Triparma laevis f. inornata TaxID=1714386 RepID=A0A9W7AGL4_9STRA|nr:hypothetical protein TL16_g05353 [Triparma laevis f. inornata]